VAQNEANRTISVDNNLEFLAKRSDDPVSGACRFLSFYGRQVMRMKRIKASSGAASRRSKTRGLGQPMKQIRTRKVGRPLGGKGGRPPRTPIKPNREWFKELLSHQHMTQAQLAAAINRHSSVLSKSLKGERRMDLDDVVGISNTLGVSPDDVIANLGYSVQPRGVPIVGKVTGEGRVSTVTARKGVLFRALQMPPDAEALVLETEGSKLAAYNGAVVVYMKTSSETPVPPDSIGRLCVVEADDHLVPILGVLKRAPQRNAVLLEVFGTGTEMTVHKLHRASIVLAIFMA
jgi:transcriptional regulator with XRE-family HTH domain